MNDAENELKRSGGAFADGLTLIRALITPVVMYLIIAKGWPSVNITLLITVLFAVAALTDLFDDMTGGTENSVYRKLGWFDDIADVILMVGTLAAMAFVFYRSQDTDITFKEPRFLLFMIPVFIIIFRELLVATIKGTEFTRTRMYEVGLGNFKTAMIMLGTCLLLATPWLRNFLDPIFSRIFSGGSASTGNELKLPDSQAFDLSNIEPGVFDIFMFTNSPVWTVGLIILWIGAILSVITGMAFLRGKYAGAANDG